MNANEEKITSVAGFIDRVNSTIQKNKKPHRRFLYRGEGQIRNTSCTPNIFRKLDFSSNDYYEKSLFDIIKQNKLLQSNTYLENAIDAQHGEFPSRLLDVSYNSLIALYFAVTPYYNKEITVHDNKDGIVFVFFADELFSPSAENTRKYFDAIINKTEPWLNSILFSKVHKIIDHTKINNRIIAQQGAFILFQGKDAELIPRYMYDTIVISKESKAKIREELSSLFGLTKSFVYPEMMNYVDDLSEKNRIVNTEPFCCENELRYVIETFSNELNYFQRVLWQERGSMEIPSKREDFFKMVQEIEMIINSYKVGIVDLLDHRKQYKVKEDPDHPFLDKIKERYNQLVENFIHQMNYLDVKISDSLKI